MWNPKEVSLSGFVPIYYSFSSIFHVLGTNVKGILTNVYGPYLMTKKQDVLDSLGRTIEWVG